MPEYKEITQYGECPSCGQSCQPDTILGSQFPDYYEEYAVCCGCGIWWEYHIDIADGIPEIWESAWLPLNIKDFRDYVPDECREE